jgi:RNA polymerase sigma-54 factor
MKLELAQNLRLEQQLKMSPQLIQRIEILQLASLDLQELIQNEIMENEVLELSEPIEENFGNGKEEKPIEDEAEIAGDAEDKDDFTLDADIERLRNLTELNRDYSPRGSAYAAGDEDPKMRAMQNTASRPVTLHDHLQNQLNLAECSEEIGKLAEQIIFNINDRGYLLHPLEEVDIPLNGEYTQEQREEALALVQTFDPKGVGARSIQECLIMQLDEKHPRYHLLHRIILNHLDDISRNRLPKVAKETGETLEAIQECIETISRLDPIPGRSFTSVDVPYIQPDVVIELVENRYEIQLEDSYYPKLGISEAYLRLATDKSLDPKLRKHIRKKIESAKWLIESIEQRKSTLYRVVEEVVNHQTEALDHGARYLKPLKMQEIADKLNIHVSTVSRAISDKYVQTPRGIFPIKFFFTGATRSSDGSVESRVGVKEKVKEIIDKEDKTHPLSDQDIVDKLKEEGLDIARRTVTKYRKALKVPSSRQRRVYGK